MYDQYTKEQLAKQADNARYVAISLAATIYKYIAGDISKDELAQAVKDHFSSDIERSLYHKIIKKDHLGFTGSISSDIETTSGLDILNDVDEIYLRED